MPEKIEEIFNDCFERLLAGESLESCIYRYPEHATELDIMLRTAFDIKRKAYPIQPRPEFKYWARVRMNGVQDYMERHPAESKPSIFHWKRSWAIALSAVLVFVLVTGGTAAASSEAMPDQPLYNVKLAVEQAQVTFTFADADKAALHARLAEKRAQEIANMASQGKTDKIIATTARMNYQLEQAVVNIQKYDSTGGTAESAATSDTSAPSTTTAPNAKPPLPSTVTDVPANIPPGKMYPDKVLRETVPPAASRQLPSTVNRAITAIDSSNTKSITVLQNALKNAPDSVKPTIQEMIERTRQTNIQVNTRWQKETDKNTTPPVIKQNTDLPMKPRPEVDKQSPVIPPDKPRTILPPKDAEPLPKGNTSKIDASNSSQSGTTSVVPTPGNTHNTTTTNSVNTTIIDRSRLLK